MAIELVEQANWKGVYLTKRQTEILTYIAEGNSNKEIANILPINEQTIKNHVSAILRKLNANHRAHAVALALHSGWISPILPTLELRIEDKVKERSKQ
jgi:DNA-binding NarL/FixJ family response regulator